jgi:hypothetical protein
MVLRLAHRQRLPQALAALALAGGLVGCSGTPFGDQLARSFSAAPPGAAPAAGTATGAATRPAARPPASGTPAAAPQPGPSPQAGGAARSAQTGAQQTGAQQTGAQQTIPGRPRPVQGQPAVPARLAPAPYRITLRLPGADPSAPAEAVTEALRAAGLSFEVEMIERVRPAPGAAGSGAAPTATPAPPPR